DQRIAVARAAEGAQCPPRRRPGEAGEIQAQGNDAYLVARRDSHRREVVAESVGNGDGDVRQAIEGRFQPPEEGGLQRTEIAPQDVAVIRVHDDGHARQARGDPPEDTGLRGVRVDDGRAGLPDGAVELPQGREIREGSDLTPEALELLHFDTLLPGQVQKIAFRRRL